MVRVGIERDIKDTGFKQLLSTNILSLLVKTTRKISRKVMNTLMTFHQNNDITKTMANNTLSSMGFLETIELLRCAARQDCKTTAPGFCARHVNIAFYSLSTLITLHLSICLPMQLGLTNKLVSKFNSLSSNFWGRGRVP